MTTTIGYRARIRFANETAPLAQLVIDTQFAVIVAAIEAGEEFAFDCGVCGNGTHEIFRRMTEDFEEVDACERCVNEYHLGYVAD